MNVILLHKSQDHCGTRDWVPLRGRTRH